MSLIYLFSSTRVFAGPNNPLESDSPVMHDIVVLIRNIMKKICCKNLFLSYSRAVITAALRFFIISRMFPWNVMFIVSIKNLVKDAKPSSCDLHDELK